MVRPPHGHDAADPAFGGHRADDVAALAQVFIDDGKAEGVRGDMAFVQSMLETGWLGFSGSQIPPDAYNYAGIYAFDGRPGARELRAWRRGAEPVHGNAATRRARADPVLAQLRRSRPRRRPRAGSSRRRRTGSGTAPLWEYFGGSNCPCGKLIWASANGYGLDIIRDVLASTRRERPRRRVRPVRAAASPARRRARDTGRSPPTAVVHPDRRRVVPRRPARALDSHAPLIGGESTSDATGYWLLGRDGGIFSYGGAHFYGSTGAIQLNKPVNGMRRTADNGGYWLVADDGGIFSVRRRPFLRLDGWLAPQPARARHGTHRQRQRLLALRFRRRHLQLRRRALLRLARRNTNSRHRSCRCNAPPTGHGYWMMTADGPSSRSATPSTVGDIGGCTNYGGAAALLATPDGRGYWIATGNGAIVPFGDAEETRVPDNGGRRPHCLLRRAN